MTDARSVRTRRLQLEAVAERDLDAHFALLTDHRTWTHLPSGRHTELRQTAETIHQARAHWSGQGLGYWTARLRVDLPASDLPIGLRPGQVVGIGGCAVRTGTTWWNLYYRFVPEAWGHGLAAELVAAALEAARERDPARPVVAYLLAHNVSSRRLAERAGLDLVWSGPDAGNPDPDALRLVYADRPLPSDLLSAIADHP